MRIAIIGTRGIPNNYGGFEQLAERLALGLVAKGHHVIVYNSHRHPFKDNLWNGIQIVHKFDPEYRIGAAGQFIYDLNCIIDSRKRKLDCVLNLGYTSSSVWMKFFPRSVRLITNMDGLEWKRSKYSKKVQGFLKMAEKWAVKGSTTLVADSIAIQKYLAETYKVQSAFIAYGADIYNETSSKLLERFNVQRHSYHLLIARMEPENNIEMILEGFSKSSSTIPFLVVGNASNSFGLHLQARFGSDPRIRFTGPIYDAAIINELRYYCALYFHGHSVGGTNPSLLEAMGCHCLIAAHDNEFNGSVLGRDAFYFSSPQHVQKLTSEYKGHDDIEKAMIAANVEKIRTRYSWAQIVREYEELMTSV
jgi:glycosyltransferase involved in cell wall biosynthesis